MSFVSGKLVLLGDSGVGKTCLLVQYLKKKFDQLEQTTTIGASYFTCKLNIDSHTINLEIWDTAGEERFKSLMPLFYRGAKAALLIFDLTSPTSFYNMQKWVVELKGNVEGTMVLAVVGNKLDLIDERKVSRDESMLYANSIGAAYFECSAKNNQGLDQLFVNVATLILRAANPSYRMAASGSGGDLAMHAPSSDLKATDVGRIEEPGINITAIAHAKPVQYTRCC